MFEVIPLFGGLSVDNLKACKSWSDDTTWKWRLYKGLELGLGIR